MKYTAKLLMNYARAFPKFSRPTWNSGRRQWIPQAADCTPHASEDMRDSLNILVHVNSIGDVLLRNGEAGGTDQQTGFIEGFMVNAPAGAKPREIEYRGAISDGTFTPICTGGDYCGSRGIATPLVEFFVRTTGDLASRYEFEYTGYFSDGTTSGSVRQGAPCRSENGAALTTLQISLVPIQVVPPLPRSNDPTGLPLNKLEGARVIYDDAEIRVVCHPGQTDFVVITFGDLYTLAKDNRFFADTPLAKLGITAVGVVAKRGNWYPPANISAASQAIWQIIRPYRTRVIYGASMGGYGAIKYSKIFGATHVISLCPQWSLDPGECNGINPGWQEHLSQPRAGMGISSNDISGKVFLFCDLFYKIDLFHCQMIERLSPMINVINVPFVEHKIAVVFSGTTKLMVLIESCLREDIKALHLFSRTHRKNNTIWTENLLKFAFKKFDRNFGAIVASQCKVNGRIRELSCYNFILALNYIIVARGAPAARTFYERFWNLLRAPIEQLQVCAYLAQKTDLQVSVTTSHQTQIMFSLRSNKCYHKISPDEQDILINIEAFGNLCALFIQMAGAKFYLIVDQQGDLVITPNATALVSPFVFQIVPAEGGLFALCSFGQYLCADSSGCVICDREAASGWEHFRFGVSPNSATKLSHGEIETRLFRSALTAYQ
jgi:hypothetical protein